MAALLGMDHPEGPDSEAEEEHDAMTAGSATAAVGSGFKLLVHWCEMQASVASLKKEATETKEWRKAKDKPDESKDAKVSALVGELATLAVNEKSHFDKYNEKSMLGQVLQSNQSAPRPPFTPNPNGRCRRCKVKGHGYPDCKATEEEAAASYAPWEGNKRERTTIAPSVPHCPSRAAANPAATTAPSVPHCPNTAAPPCICTHMSPSILSAAMALIACCTQPRTLEQLNEREPEAQGSRDMEMSGSQEDGTGTTLQWCASISNEPMLGDNQDTQRTSKVQRANAPQEQQ